MSQYMASTLSHFENTAEDYSTGYLQDVLLQCFSSKRRRLLMSEEDERSNKLADESCWDSSLTGKKSDKTISDTKTPPEETTSETLLYDSSLSSQKESTEYNQQWTPAKEHLYSAFSFGASNGKIKRMPELVQQAKHKVVYPFSLIKPGGFEGVATLNDINERILLPPTRPVRHPVGDFACRPILVSPNGPGLSGKAVVAFTRIHTQGRRGTITIIRTRS